MVKLTNYVVFDGKHVYFVDMFETINSNTNFITQLCSTTNNCVIVKDTHTSYVR